MKKIAGFSGILLLLTILFLSFSSKNEKRRISGEKKTAVAKPRHGLYTASFEKDLLVKNFFKTLDSIIVKYDTITGLQLSDAILCRANPWIMDSLKSFDYYKKIEKGIFIEDQTSLVLFHKGDSLWIPDKAFVDSVQYLLDHTILDINIPEYKFRIIENNDTVHTCKVRVGRHTTRYLQTIGRVADLRTSTGVGKIIRIEENPIYVNPVDGHRYYSTKRDDGKYTKMPLLPWLEPELNGLRYGQLIHPTTNIETLGKAYSNGCIGTSESDAWEIYFHTQLGTQVNFHYDLVVKDENGDSVCIRDIYCREH